MGLFDKLFGKKNKINTNQSNNYYNLPQNKKLEYIKNLEKTHDIKIRSQGEKYYFSEEAKIRGKKISHLQNEYIKEYPTDFLYAGANLFQFMWPYVDELQSIDKKIFIMVGEGRFNESSEDYVKAIECYQKADDLTMDALHDEIQELIKENGPGDYLYTAKIRQRINVCQNKIIKNKTVHLELKAKELEKENPKEAIEIYHHLNELRPGMKKYDKRIKVCQDKIFKKEIRELELNAKEFESQNVEKAIEIYEELNKLRPGMKKYNKRIEICKNKLS